MCGLGFKALTVYFVFKEGSFKGRSLFLRSPVKGSRVLGCREDCFGVYRTEAQFVATSLSMHALKLAAASVPDSILIRAPLDTLAQWRSSGPKALKEPLEITDSIPKDRDKTPKEP